MLGVVVGVVDWIVVGGGVVVVVGVDFWFDESVFGIDWVEFVVF